MGTFHSGDAVRHELDFFKVASGLSLEFDQKSVDAEKLNGVQVDLPDQFNDQSPVKY